MRNFESSSYFNRGGRGKKALAIGLALATAPMPLIGGVQQDTTKAADRITGVTPPPLRQEVQRVRPKGDEIIPRVKKQEVRRGKGGTKEILGSPLETDSLGEGSGDPAVNLAIRNQTRRKVLQEAETERDLEPLPFSTSQESAMEEVLAVLRGKVKGKLHPTGEWVMRLLEEKRAITRVLSAKELAMRSGAADVSKRDFSLLQILAEEILRRFEAERSEKKDKREEEQKDAQKLSDEELENRLWALYGELMEIGMAKLNITVERLNACNPDKAQFLTDRCRKEGAKQNPKLGKELTILLKERARRAKEEGEHMRNASPVDAQPKKQQAMTREEKQAPLFEEENYALEAFQRQEFDQKWEEGHGQIDVQHQYGKRKKGKRFLSDFADDGQKRRKGYGSPLGIKRKFKFYAGIGESKLGHRVVKDLYLTRYKRNGKGNGKMSSDLWTSSEDLGRTVQAEDAIQKIREIESSRLQWEEVQRRLADQYQWDVTYGRRLTYKPFEDSAALKGIATTTTAQINSALDQGPAALN